MQEPSTFEDDLKIWEEFELYVCKILKEKYGLDYIKNPNKLWVDLFGQLWPIEVKHDKKSDYSWNYFIEIMCSWCFSWIFKYKEMKYYAIWHFDEFYIIEKEILKWIMLLYWKKVIWWDANNSTWYIVEKKYIKKYSKFNY